MPKIDNAAYEAATATSGNGFSQMLPGAYICRVQAVHTEGDTRSSGHWTCDEKQYVEVIYDIADGEFAGKYSDDFFIGKDYAHRFYLSWKNLGFLKSRLNAFTESNPGFDAKAAFDADKWEMFVGKYFGAVLDGTVSTNDSGYDRWTFDVGDVVPVQAVYDGKCREPRITDNRDKGGTSTAATDAYSDIPFSVE